MTPHISTPALHRYRLGESSPAEREAIRAHLDACPRCSERLRLQEAGRAAFVLEPVPEFLRAPPPARRRHLPWAAPFAAALAAVLVVVLFPLAGRGPTDPATLRTKGEITAMEVVAERDSGPVVLAPGARVVPGDRLQIRFDPGPYPWAAFVGRDGSGSIEVFRILPVEPGPLRSAPFALELDDTPGDEQIFVVFSDTPPDPEWLVGVLDDGGSAGGAVVTSIRLRKDTRR
ncbi:MAG: zf-HC2 domain-containing protein [Deltaproteobacteria bacterium]|nr:zf-HC2 domain-containing protein [Deltaproteobacteria bacterium]